MEEDIAGIDRNLPATARRIDDILGDGIASGMSTKALNDFNPLGDRSAQVGRSLNEIALIEIVGTHAAAQELLHERLHHRQTVVHTT